MNENFRDIIINEIFGGGENSPNGEGDEKALRVFLGKNPPNLLYFKAKTFQFSIFKICLLACC
jgi:hypothetical protein